MLSVGMRSLWAHKRRLLTTVAAVAIGVSFLAGTLVLGDTTRSSFDDLFNRVNAGTDVVVRPATPGGAGGAEHDGTDFVVLLDQSVVGRLEGVDGVDRAVPTVAGYGRLIGAGGEPVGGMGPPTMAASWIDEPRLNPYRLAEGTAPVRDTDVVIDRAAAATGRLHVGDTAVVQTPEPVTVTITGLVTFGDRDSAGGMTFVGFTLEGAQRHVVHQPGKVTAVSVAGHAGVSQDELARRVTAALPPGTEAVTGTQLSRDQRAAIDGDFLDFFNWFLLVFAGIALLVAAFSIYNTFSILTAQRTRESALLRALGASRRQVLVSALIETVAVGVAASAIGLGTGIGLAVGLRELFALLGADLPAEGLVLSLRTVLITLGVGTVVTVLAGLLPARRSSRVAPLAALRDVAVDTSATSVARLATGALFTVAGGALVLHAALSGGDGVLVRAAAGAVVGLVGVVILGPAMAAVVSPVLGWPLAATRGTTGRLARENARRNPRRTSGTAAALMIGVAVVTMFTVMAQSMKTSVEQTLTRAFGGDLVVTMEGSGLPPSVVQQLGAAPEVRTAVGLGSASARLDGRSEHLTVAEPVALTRVLNLDVVGGSVEGLGDHQLAVSSERATERGWALGTRVPVAFLDGTSEDFTVGAVFDQSDVLGGLVMRRAEWAPHGVQDRDEVVLLKLRDGVPMADGRAVVERVTKPYAGAQVQDVDQYVASVGAEINQALMLVYVMLVLAIVIALMGIANTLSLSIHERVRELGLLRAVGQTRRQVRSMVRGESVIIALFGTLSGVGLGLFLGWALVRAASSEGIGTFSAAPVQLLVVALVGGVAGVVAARRPARRASRLDVLTAIAAD
jgi:putative ABC transport system permease protein